jgi:hypothetical protein
MRVPPKDCPLFTFFLPHLFVFMPEKATRSWGKSTEDATSLASDDDTASKQLLSTKLNDTSPAKLTPAQVPDSQLIKAIGDRSNPHMEPYEVGGDEIRLLTSCASTHYGTRYTMKLLEQESESRGSHLKQEP